MKKNTHLCFLFFLFIAGCGNKAPMLDKIKVQNKLDKKIICVFGYNYPDLSLNFTNKAALLADSNLLQIDTNEVKEIDTIGLCKKEVWYQHIRQSLLMLDVFDKAKLLHAKKLEDALIERYYFSYTQVLKEKGLIVVY